MRTIMIVTMAALLLTFSTQADAMTLGSLRPGLIRATAHAHDLQQNESNGLPWLIKTIEVSYSALSQQWFDILAAKQKMTKLVIQSQISEGYLGNFYCQNSRFHAIYNHVI